MEPNHSFGPARRLLIQGSTVLVAALGVAAILLGTANAQASRPAAPKTAPPPPKPAPGAVCQPGEASFFRDEGLTMKVATKLQFTKALLREKVNVKVSGGVATLSGGLSTPDHIALAVSIASQVEGIRCVNNFLKVGPPEPSPSTEPRG